MTEAATFRAGLIYGLIAYLWWGFMPLYFSQLRGFPPFELLAQRVVWSVVAVGLLVTIQGGWHKVRRALADGPTRRMLFLSTILIAINWVTFIYGVLLNRVLETSLGYFTTPLFNVVLGIAVFRERLRVLQWFAVACAVVGVSILFIGADRFPWIALTLVFSFGCYGLIRKFIAIDGVTGLLVETILLLPICLPYLLVLAYQGEMRFGQGPLLVDTMIVLSGAMTAVPLICFAQAVIRLKFTTIGFLQYISPSMQFVVAITVLGELFTPAFQWSFSVIWLGLILFIYDVMMHKKPPPVISK